MAAEAIAPDARRAARVGRPSWVNARITLGMILFAVALVGGQRLLADARTTVPVWAAARDLPQDARLGPDDLEVVGVRIPSDLLGRYARGSMDLSGRVLTRPVLAGELVPAAALAGDDAAAGGRAMTIPVTAGHSGGTGLRPGDRVDVFATFDASNPAARTVLLAASVPVMEVLRGQGLAVGEDAPLGITVGVDPGQAARLAFAVRTAEIDIVRVIGPSGEDSVPTVRTGDFP